MKIPCAAVAALLWSCAHVAWAQPASAPAGGAEPLDRQARVWAASCAACHGTDGRSKGGVPPIAGRDVETNWRALQEFRNNLRPTATLMTQHVKGYTDDELMRIVRYLATVPAQ